MSAQCKSVLKGYRPYDADRGIEHEARDVHCTAPVDHDGWHQGDDGMIFGPLVQERGGDPS